MNPAAFAPASPRLVDDRLVPAFADDPAETIAPLNVLVLYENAASARRALRTLGRLVRGVGAEIEVHCHFCRLDLLPEPFTSELSFPDLAQADMLIVSREASGELPASIRHSLDRHLLQRGDRNVAVLSLFATEDTWGLALSDDDGFYTARKTANRPPAFAVETTADVVLDRCA